MSTAPIISTVPTWLPESERDSSYYIFVPLFKCQVSNIQTMSIDYLQLHGMPSCGDTRLDKETANELITRMLPISEMVKFFNKGVLVQVSNYQDTVKIYEYISNHLNFWKQELTVSLNTRGAPIEDLMMIDKFANAVYQHAKYQFDDVVVDSIIARRMSSVMSFNRENIIKHMYTPEAATINGEEEEQPERASMADVFSSHKFLGGSGPKWR